MGSGCSTNANDAVSEPLPSRHAQAPQVIHDPKQRIASTKNAQQERSMSVSSMHPPSVADIGSPEITRSLYVSPEMQSSPPAAVKTNDDVQEPVPHIPLSELVAKPLGDVLTTLQTDMLRMMAECTCDVNNRVEEFAVRKVSCPPQLKKLSKANSVNTEFFLSAIQHVFGLDMHSMELNVEHLAPLLQVTPHLRVLDLRSNKFGLVGTAWLLKPLSRMQNLQKLQLGGNLVGAEGATALAECLPILPALKQLYLHNNEIGDSGATSLGECLGDKLPNLEVLWLALNNIGEAGGIVLAEQLKRVTMLQKLELGDNINIGPAGATALAAAVERCTNLQHLLLSNTGITDAGVRALTPSLCVAEKMKVLRLTGNSIGPRGAKAIGESLTSMYDLELLRLTGNPIGEKGMEKLAPSMETLQSLKYLYLTGCGIGDLGAAFLGPALATLVRLEELDLSANGISDQGAEDLAPAFHSLTALESLDVHKNLIAATGTRSMVLYLLETTTLENLELDVNPSAVDFERHLPWEVVKFGWNPVLKHLQELYTKGELDDIVPFIRPISPTEDAKARAAARAALRPARGASSMALMQWNGPNAASPLAFSSSTKPGALAGAPREAPGRSVSPQLRRQSTEALRPRSTEQLRRQSTETLRPRSTDQLRRQSTETLRPKSTESNRRSPLTLEQRGQNRKGSFGVASIAAGTGAFLLS